MFLPRLVNFLAVSFGIFLLVRQSISVIGKKWGNAGHKPGDDTKAVEDFRKIQKYICYWRKGRALQRLMRN